MSRVEAGTRGLRFAKLDKLARTLGVPVTDLVAADEVAFAPDLEDYHPPKGSVVAKALATSTQRMFRVLSGVLSELNLGENALIVAEMDEKAVKSAGNGSVVIVSMASKESDPVLLASSVYRALSSYNQQPRAKFFADPHAGCARQDCRSCHSLVHKFTLSLDFALNKFYCLYGERPPILACTFTHMAFPRNDPPSSSGGRRRPRPTSTISSLKRKRERALLPGAHAGSVRPRILSWAGAHYARPR